MSLYSASAESQTAQLAGAPSGTTFNGYFAALVAGASANFKLRRLVIGIRAGTGAPTSQQVTVGIYRQTVRVVGTGFSTITGSALDQRGAASSITGLDYTTGTTAGTTGPTIAATPLYRFTFNTQTGVDLPFDGPDEDVVIDQGTANGLAFVNLGNALPASHLFTITAVWDE